MEVVPAVWSEAVGARCNGVGMKIVLIGFGLLAYMGLCLATVFL